MKRKNEGEAGLFSVFCYETKQNKTICTLCSFFHSFHKDLLSIASVPDTLLPTAAVKRSTCLWHLQPHGGGQGVVVGEKQLTGNMREYVRQWERVMLGTKAG